MKIFIILSLKIGLIVLLILGILFFILKFLIKDVLFYVWSPFFYTFGIIDPTLVFLIKLAQTFAYTLILIFFLGSISQIKIKKISLRKINIINYLGERIKKIQDITNMLKGRNFVLIRDYPSPGHNEIGIITGKIILRYDDGTKKAYPKVFLPSPPIPFSGLLDFPERSKVERMISQSNLILEILFTLGLLGPDSLELKKAETDFELDTYYSAD